MVGLTKAQRLAKNRKMFDDFVKNTGMYKYFLSEGIPIGDTLTMVEEIEQDLINLLPKKAKPKIAEWSYNVMGYGTSYMFKLAIHTMQNIDMRPYIMIRKIQINETMSGNGYAESIIKILIQKSKAYGYDGVAIECITSPILKHIAEKMGFTPIHDSTSYFLCTKDNEGQ